MNKLVKSLVLFFHLFLGSLIIFEATVDGDRSGDKSKNLGTFIANIINKVDVSKIVEPTKIEITNNEAYYDVYDKVEITASTYPSNSSYLDYKVTSSSPNVEINNKTVTFLKEGKAVIEVINTHNQNVKDSYTFYASNVKEEEFFFDLESTVLYKEKPTRIKLAVVPENTTFRNVKFTYIEDNVEKETSSYLTLENNYFKVKKVSLNPFKIKATLNDNLSKEIEVTTNYLHLVKLEKVDIKLPSEIILNKPFKPLITYNPSNASIKDFIINDNENFKLENGSIIPLKKGNLLLELTFPYSNIISRLSINVLDDSTRKLNYSLNSNSIQVNSSLTINHEGNLNFESLNKDIIDVDNNGNIYGKALGKGEIKIFNDLYSEIIEIEVINDLNSVSNLEFPKVLKVGEGFSLSSYPSLSLKFDHNYFNYYNSLLTPLKSGKSQVEAYYNNQSVVFDLLIEEVKVSNIDLSINEHIYTSNVINLDIYTSSKLNFIYDTTPSLATNVEIIQDNVCLYYDEINNEIIALNKGKAFMRVTNGDYLKEYEVVINDKLPSSLVINLPSLTFTSGSETYLTSNIDNHPYFNKVIYSSSDPSIAKINDNKITFLSGGKVLISAFCYYNKELTTQVEIEVLNTFGFTYKLDLKKIDDVYKLPRGTSKKININYFETTSYRNVTFVSSNKNILNVDDNGNILGLNKGICTLKIISEDGKGSYSEEIKIEVTSKVLIENLTTFLSKSRKVIGHYLLFMSFGMFATLTYVLFIKNENLKFYGALISLIEGGIFAYISEYIQKFTPNRHYSIKDMRIDMNGYVLGLIAIYIIYICYLTYLKRVRER